MDGEFSASHRSAGRSRGSFTKREVPTDFSLKIGDVDESHNLSDNCSDISSPQPRQVGSSVSSSSTQQSKGVSKNRPMDLISNLTEVADGLMTKLYRLRQILDHPETGSLQFSDAFWKAGIFPVFPKLCIHIARKFPEHPGKLQLEKLDKGALDQLHENAEVYLNSMHPWWEVLVDLMKFREQALKAIMDLSSTVITLLPHQNPIVLHAFMNFFCLFIRVNLLSDKIPRKMLIQSYNLTHSLLGNGRDHEFYHRLVQFVDSYDPPMKGLQEDLSSVSPRIGEVLEAIAQTVFLGADYQKLRTEGFLSPFHPRYPEKLTNSAHPARAQELVHVERYREWVLFGYLACPSAVLRLSGTDIAMAVLKDTLVLSLFRDEYILLHEEFQSFVLPKITESKKMAKSGRTKQRDAGQDYSLSKQVERMIIEVHDLAIGKCESIHREQRTLLKQELGKMVQFFSDQPTLIAPNIQMIFSALAMAKFEVVWYFTHVGVLSGKARGARVVPVEIDASDPTIGFLLDSMDRLCGLIRKYALAVRGHALGYLASASERMKTLLTCRGMAALDIDMELKQLFASVSDCLDSLPKVQNGKVENISIDLSPFRRDWLSIIMLVSSSRSMVNVRHLEKATISTGKESIIAEGNLAYLWSRSVDETESQLSEHSSLKVLCFYRQHLTTVFRHTMFGPEGRPQHCCAWLGVASSFPENGNISVPDEASKLAGEAVAYAESILESIMGGFEGLINIMDSEGGIGSLEYKLLPDQAALRMNQAVRSGNTTMKSMKFVTDLPLPGSESDPSNRDSIKMLEAAVQRLTSLCTVLNEMEPICIMNHVFVPREYLRDRVISNFRRRLRNILKADGNLQRPTVLESLVHRHIHIVHLIEQHVSMDLTQGLREVLLTEAFAGPMEEFEHQNGHNSSNNNGDSGVSVSTICDWYVQNILKDGMGMSIVYVPEEKSFRSARSSGGDVVASLSELKAFVRVFGPYGVEKFDRLIKEHLEVLLNFIDVALDSKKEVLQHLSRTMHIRGERETIIKQVNEIETIMNFSLQIGHALSLRWLLTQAASEVAQSNSPLPLGLLSNFVKHIPPSFPEKDEICKLKMLASRIGATVDQDIIIVQSVLRNMGGVNDSWTLLPYLFVSCMASHTWNASVFSIHTGGFNNNVHCLARCIHAVMVAFEFTRVEQIEMQKQHSGIRGSEDGARSESEMLAMEGLAIVEGNVKSMMKTFVQCAAAIALDSWNDTNRSALVARLVFLDQLCEISKYLPRSTLEAHVPYTILRSIYQLYYENAVPTLVLIGPLRRNTTGLAASHAPLRSASYLNDPMAETNEGSSSLRGAYLAGQAKLAAQRKKGPDMETLGETRPVGGQNIRRSGPLDYGTNNRIPSVTASDSASSTSPHQRYPPSRSGPVSYK